MYANWGRAVGATCALALLCPAAPARAETADDYTNLDLHELAAAVSTLGTKQRRRSGPPLLHQAAEEIQDAIRVLSGADLHDDAVTDLRAALALIPPEPRPRDLNSENMNALTALLDQARARILF